MKYDRNVQYLLQILFALALLLGALRGFRISGLKCTEKGRGKLRRKLDSGVVIEFLVFGC